MVIEAPGLWLIVAHGFLVDSSEGKIVQHLQFF